MFCFDGVTLIETLTNGKVVGYIAKKTAFRSKSPRFTKNTRSNQGLHDQFPLIHPFPLP